MNLILCVRAVLRNFSRHLLEHILFKNFTAHADSQKTYGKKAGIQICNP